MKKIRAEYMNAELINIVSFLLGVLQVVMGVILKNINPDLEVIMISIGASIIASSIIVSISSRYLIRRNNIREIIERWGLIGIYKTRAEMNQSADKTLEKLEKELDMIGFGFRAFRNAKGPEIEGKVRKGLRIRILTMNPESPIVAQREKDEIEVAGQIKNTIMELITWTEKLKKLSPKPEYIQLKFYDNLPLQSYYRQDDYIYMGPYLYGKPSQQTISYEFFKNSLGYDYWNSYFNTLWENDKFAKNKPQECIKSIY